MFKFLAGLPYTDNSYRQAPYQDITEEEYIEFVKQMPKKINWVELSKFEEEDNTRGSQSYSCTGDKCEIVDLT